MLGEHPCDRREDRAYACADLAENALEVAIELPTCRGGRSGEPNGQGLCLGAPEIELQALQVLSAHQRDNLVEPLFNGAAPSLGGTGQHAGARCRGVHNAPERCNLLPNGALDLGVEPEPQGYEPGNQQDAGDAKAQKIRCCSARVPDIEPRDASEDKNDAGALRAHLQERAIELVLHDRGDGCAEAPGAEQPIADGQEPGQCHPDHGVEQPLRAPDARQKILDGMEWLILAQRLVVTAHEVVVVEHAERQSNGGRQEDTDRPEDAMNALGDLLGADVELTGAVYV